MRARFILVLLSWQPKAGGETGNSIRCITSRSSALITTANRSAEALRKLVEHQASSSLSVARDEHRQNNFKCILAIFYCFPYSLVLEVLTLQVGVVDIDESKMVPLCVNKGSPMGCCCLLFVWWWSYKAWRSC